MPDTAVEFEFGDGEYRFWLPLPQAIELQRKCGVKDIEGKFHPKSLFTIYEELGAGIGKDAEGQLHWIGGGEALVEQANEVLRLGLIGGNCGPVDEEGTAVGPLRAKRLVELYGYPERPLREVVTSAWRILNAAIVGIDVKKKDNPAQAEEQTPPSPKEPFSPTADS